VEHDKKLRRKSRLNDVLINSNQQRTQLNLTTSTTKFMIEFTK